MRGMRDEGAGEREGMAFGPDDLDRAETPVRGAPLRADAVRGEGVQDDAGNPWGDEPMPEDPEHDDVPTGLHTMGGPPRNHDGAEPLAGHHRPSAPAGESTADDATPATGPVSRRRALQVLGMLPLAGALSSLGAQQTGTGGQQSQQGHATPNPQTGTPQPARNTPKLAFFTRAELRTVRVLSDDVIPKDARSGSATEAGVPEFIDFNLSVPETDEATRTAWRGGLRWLDTETKRRYNVAYAAATRAQRHAVLDDISFPKGVPKGVPQGGIPPHLQPGAAFFARARDMIASGFFSSAMGHRDLRWQGNTFNPVWNGCPPEALQKLGVNEDMMTPRQKPASG